LILLLSFFIMAGCSSSKKAVQTPPAEEPMEPTVTSESEPSAYTKPTEETKTATESAPAMPFVLQNVYFEFDRYELTPEALQTLADNARVLKAYPDAQIIIEGHCDERGTVEYNLALGDKRAKAAKDYLISLGVNPPQISTISYGKERPLDTRHSEEGWARNRRAEFARR
jgi:peptidoglycan-associated lipoprotein